MTRSRVSLLMPISLLLALGLGAAAKAQYLISTKAGFANRVEGEVYILRADGEDGEKERAALGAQMRPGDRLSVAAKSFAETLLNPGSYLRLNENTEVRALSVDLDSVRFELIKGSVIAEIGQIDRKSPIEIITPHGALTIAKAGLYRIDTKESETRVAVRQGEIHLGNRDDFAAKRSFKIKSGKVATLAGSAQFGQPEIAKLDKDAIDQFDTWSFNRAETLTLANVRALRRSQSGFLNSGWIYDASFNTYTFVPTRSWFWSPYGFGFFNNYRDCHYYNPYYSSGTSHANSGGSPNGKAGSSGNVNGTRVAPRVVAGNDRGAVTRATDRRWGSVDSGFGSESGGRWSRGGGQSGSSGGASTPSSTSAPRSNPGFGGASRGADGGHRGGGATPARGRIH